jgi:carboxyl-terminal processing protease
MTFKKSFFMTLLVAAVIAAAFFAGFYTHERLFGNTSHPILDQSYELIKNHGLQPLPEDPLIEYGMIRGMLQAYNEPHTYFVEPVQHELQSDTLGGKFGGIGVTLGRDEANYHIVFPFPGSPAEQAGLQDHDRILAVDGKPITPETSVEDLQAAVRGEVGTKVKLIMGRPPDYQEFEVTIVRTEIAIPSTTWRIEPVEPRLGIIRVSVIAASTPDEITQAIHELQSKGATHFALDLRDNSGGLLTSGVDTARLFLSDGIVIEQQYRDEPVKSFNVEKSGPFFDIPLVILVNENSASASEIIAGALQAQKRALLIGRPTYGKNTIQLVFELKDQSSLHITAAKWWVPGLDTPQPGMGLQPDLLLDQAYGDPDPAILAAIQAFFGE